MSHKGDTGRSQRAPKRLADEVDAGLLAITWTAGRLGSFAVRAHLRTLGVLPADLEVKNSLAVRF